jgi:hypothetical protein
VGHYPSGSESAVSNDLAMLGPTLRVAVLIHDALCAIAESQIPHPIPRQFQRSGHVSLGDRVLVISAAGRAQEARIAARQAANEAALTHDVNKEMFRPSKRARRPAAGGRLYRPGIVPISHPRESQEFP